MRKKTFTTILNILLITGIYAVGLLYQPKPAFAQVNCAVSPGDLALVPQEIELMQLINEYRAQNGLGIFQWSSPLVRSSAWAARDMATFPYYTGHIDRLGRDALARILDCGLSDSNIWRGDWVVTSYQTPSEALTWWKLSPPHNAQLLNPSWKAAAVGFVYAPEAPKLYYWVLSAAYDFDSHGIMSIGSITPPTQPTPTSTSSGTSDLTIWSHKYIPLNPTVGSQVNFDSMIRNQGIDTAGASKTRFTLDIQTDGSTANDPAPWDFQTSALAAGGSESENTTSIPRSWAAVAGTHTFTVCADVTGVVAESNESNNCSSFDFTVSAFTPVSTPIPTPTPTPIPVLIPTPTPNPTPFPTNNPSGTPPTLDAQSSSTIPDSTSLSWNHTTGSCTNRILLVGVASRRGNSGMTSVTYNGTKLTNIRSDTLGTDVRTELWYLVNPPSGTYSVQLSSPVSNSISAGATTFCNVSQISPISSHAGNFNQNPGTTAAVQIASTPNDTLVDVIGTQNAGISLTPASGQTQILNITGAWNRVAQSSKPGASSVIMSWTLNGSEYWAASAVSLRPTGSSVASSPTPAPTPIPTSTPAPVFTACSITSASWGSTSSTVVAGTKVNLNANVSGSCTGQQVSFEVRQNVTLLPDANITTIVAPIIGNSAQASWTTTWNNACLVGTCDPQYFFNAQVAGAGTPLVRSANPLLTVTKPPTPSPSASPTPASTSNPADTQPPSTPTNLTATAISSSQVNLSWNPSSDNVGIAGYDIYRNGTKVATAASTSYGDANLISSTLYTYFVKAIDSTGNVSPSSNTASATTQPPPQTAGAGSIKGTVTSSAGGAVSGVNVSTAVGSSKKTVSTNSQGSYTFTGLPAGTYSVTFQRRNYRSQTVSVTVGTNQSVVKNITLIRRS